MVSGWKLTVGRLNTPHAPRLQVYTGVGARRIRETFEKLRTNAPAILFVDEFDALGAARGAQASGDESASIINELLVRGKLHSLEAKPAHVRSPS